MFRVITPGDRAGQADLLDEMFRMRGRHQAQYMDPGIPGTPAEEIDRFDTEASVYIIVQNDAREIVGTARLNPTLRPHMLSDVFAGRCDLQPLPRGQDVWECSRFLIDPALKADPVEEIQIRCRLAIGLIAWSLDHGIRRLSWLARQDIYNFALRSWKTEPLGLPWREGDDWSWIPAVSDIDQDTLDRQLDWFRNAECIVQKYLSPTGTRSVRHPPD